MFKNFVRLEKKKDTRLSKSIESLEIVSLKGKRTFRKYEKGDLELMEAFTHENVLHFYNYTEYMQGTSSEKKGCEIFIENDQVDRISKLLCQVYCGDLPSYMSKRVGLPFELNRIDKWSCSDVVDFIKSLNFANREEKRIVRAFSDNDIDGIILRELDLTCLQNIGLTESVSVDLLGLIYGNVKNQEYLSRLRSTFRRKMDNTGLMYGSFSEDVYESFLLGSIYANNLFNSFPTSSVSTTDEAEAAGEEDSSKSAALGSIRLNFSVQTKKRNPLRNIISGILPSLLQISPPTTERRIEGIDRFLVFLVWLCMQEGGECEFSRIPLDVLRYCIVPFIPKTELCGEGLWFSAEFFIGCAAKTKKQWTRFTFLPPGVFLNLGVSKDNSSGSLSLCENVGNENMWKLAKLLCKVNCEAPDSVSCYDFYSQLAEVLGLEKSEGLIRHLLHFAKRANKDKSNQKKCSSQLFQFPVIWRPSACTVSAFKLPKEEYEFLSHSMLDNFCRDAIDLETLKNKVCVEDWEILREFDKFFWKMHFSQRNVRRFQTVHHCGDVETQPDISCRKC